MEYLLAAAALALGYYYVTHEKEIRDRFWRWIESKSPYFKVATDVYLTEKGMKKYLPAALMSKYLQVKGQLENLTAKLQEIEQKIYASKTAEQAQSEWLSEELQEILSKPILLRPPKIVKVYDADYNFRGYLEYIAGDHFNEVYVVVRTPKNERQIFGPAPINEIIMNDRTLGEQIRSGILVLAYDSNGRKISPVFVRTEV